MIKHASQEPDRIPQRIATVRTLLLSEWDPIGIHDEPAAQDEYDTYAAVIVDMLSAGARPTEIADYLVGVEERAMGLEANPARAASVAAALAEVA